MPYRPSEREGGWALPDSLDEVVAPDHSVRFVAAFLDGLGAEEWQALGISLEAAALGAPRYHPRILLAVWVWGFMLGVRSSRRLEEACRERVSFWWLTGRQCPDHNTLWRFYRAHRAGMRQLLKLSVRTAVRLELVDLALQAVDGTKVAGNAAKERTYDRAGLDRLEERIERALADLEAQNATDPAPPSPRLPAALASMARLRERVRAARAGLAEGERVNLSDPQARLMKGRGGFVAGYNAQAMVAPLEVATAGAGGMLITAAVVSTDPDDHGQLVPLLEAAAETSGQRAAVTAADGGYHSGPNLAACAARGQRIVMPEAQGERVGDPYHQGQFTYAAATDTYTCPRGAALTFLRVSARKDRPPVRVYGAPAARCRACPAFGTCTTDRRGRRIEVGPHEPLLQAHRAWMATPAARRLYARRKGLVEPVFGILKECQGGRRFLLRGRAAVQAEWGLLAAAFNLRTLAAIWRRRPRLFAA